VDRIRTRWLGWAALASATILAGCQAPAPVEPLEVVANRSEWRYGRTRGQRIRTEHWEVFTTIAEDMTLAVLPEFLERAWAQYARLVPLTKPPARPLVCYVFQRRGEWELFVRRTAGGRARKYLRIRNGGYSEADLAAVHYAGRAQTLAVLSHEGLHQYLAVNTADAVPAWLNEGLATWCEGFRWDGRSVTFAPRENVFRSGALQRAALASQLYPLGELLAINAGHVVGTEAPKVAAYYAQVWALVYFLHDGMDGRYRSAFESMLNDVSAGRLGTRARGYMAASAGRSISYGQAAFQCCITEDLDAFEAEFLAFVQKLQGP